MPPRPAPPGRDTRGRFVASGKPAPAAAGGRLGRLRRFLWSGVILGGVALVVTAASDTAKDALKAGFGAFATGQQACAAREWWARNFGTPLPADPGRFRVLVARLHDDDGKLSRQVARAFTGERGFGVVTTCRTVDLDGDDVTAASVAAEREAEALRAGRGADLIVWGQGADVGAGAVRLWFSAASVRPSMTRAPWKIEQGSLSGEFQKEFALALQAMALTAVPPASDAQGRAVAALLRPRLPPLRALVAQPPQGLPQDDRSALRWTLAGALRTFGHQAGDNAALREGTEQYRLLLNEWPRERAPLAWAATQNNLGVALQTLGEREGDAARLEQAVAAHRAALEEWTRERAPLDWAMTQNNLGVALATLGGRGGNAARLEQAAAAYRAALEERTRERAPFLWAQTMENIARAEAASGQKSGDHARFQAALDACEAAWEEYRRAEAAFYIRDAKRLRDWLAARLTTLP